METFFSKNNTIKKYICAFFLFLSVISSFKTIIVFNEEIQERPLLAALDLKSVSYYNGITKYLTPDDNAIRIVARYEDINAEEIPLKIELIKEGSIIYSDVFEPKTTTGYSKPDFKKGLLGRENAWYWDYGTFNIKSKGNYRIKIIPKISLESFKVFDVFISKNNSEKIVHYWVIITIVLLVIGVFFGRNIKITLK